MIMHRLEIPERHSNDTVRCKMLTLDTTVNDIDAVVNLVISWIYHIIGILKLNVLSDMVQLLLLCDSNFSGVMMAIVTRLGTITDPVSTCKSTNWIRGIHTSYRMYHIGSATTPACTAACALRRSVLNASRIVGCIVAMALAGDKKWNQRG
jgi:hypothetical protein